MSLWGPLLAYDDLIEKAEDQNINQSLGILRAAVKKVQQRGYNVEAITLRGSVHEEIISWVNETRPTLVILGTDRDEGFLGLGLRKLLNNSITTSIVSGSQVSVLICK
jgi:nucleotide-binding universal stress UspA family protein